MLEFLVRFIHVTFCLPFYAVVFRKHFAFFFFALSGVARMKLKALIHLQLPIYTERHRTGQYSFSREISSVISKYSQLTCCTSKKSQRGKPYCLNVAVESYFHLPKKSRDSTVPCCINAQARAHVGRAQRLSAKRIQVKGLTSL